MSHGMAMILNMLVWLAVTAVVVGVPVILFKAIKEYFRRRGIKKELQAKYGYKWELVYHYLFSKHPNEEIKKEVAKIDPINFGSGYQQSQPIQPVRQVFQPAPRPQFPVTPGVPSVASSIVYNLYPTQNGPINQALLAGSPRRGREWFRGVNAYWAVQDSEIEQDPRIHGKPGVGLNASGFSQANIEAGQRGERNLAKLMHKWGLTNGGVETFWSMALPNSNYDTDVDAIMVYGDTVYLIDAKNYAIGNDNETYILDPRDLSQSTLVRIDQAGNYVPNSEHKLSKSMVMAVDKYTPYLKAVDPNVKIVAAVVLCPDKNGTPAVGPNLVAMQGKMPVMSCTDFLQALRKESAGKTANPVLCSMLMPLLKSGDASDKNLGSVQTQPATTVRPAQTRTYTAPAPAVVPPVPVTSPVPAPAGIMNPPTAGPAASFTYND